jgi:oxidase EvaA
VLFDTKQSEEGGRFYHEQNHNVIIDLKEDLGQLPPEYMWVDYSTLNYMVQFNNVLNIQLRNLLSLLDI